VRSSEDGKREIYVDQENADEIINYIDQDARHRKKFRIISDIILNGLRNTNLYDKEEINKQSKGVTAMKFFKGQENDRLYCKEVTRGDKVFVVIMVALRLKKKSQKLSHREKNIIEKVASYEYELEK
jgi:hypothetical protein